MVRAFLHAMLALSILSCAHRAGERELDGLADALSESKVVSAARLVAHVRAVGRLPDVSGIMTHKARLLVSIARLRDEDVEPYRTPEGELRDAAWLRRLAVGFLVRSNLYLNQQEVRELVSERMAGGTDALEQLLLAPLRDAVLEPATRAGALGDHVPQYAHALMSSWLGWIRASLDHPFDPVTFELVCARLDTAGRYARLVRLDSDVRALAEAVIGTRGDVALTRGVPGASLDLLRAALGTRYDLDHMTRPQTVGMPRTHRMYDPWASLRDDPRPLRADANDRFAALAAPLLRRPMPFDASTYGRIRDAFAVRGVDRDRRAALLASLLTLRDGDVARYDASRDDEMTVVPHGPTALMHEAARALAAEPDWIAHPKIAEVVAQLARRPFDPSGDLDRDEPLLTLQPVAADLLRARAASDVPSAVAIARAWMTSVRSILPRVDNTYYASPVAGARLISLAEVAPRLGIVDDVRALCAAVIAAPLPHESLQHVHADLVRSATVARDTL